MKTAHSKTVLRRALLAACLLVAIAWFTPLQVLAASGQSTSQAMILGAVVNQTNSTMTISGRNFSSNPLTQPFDAVVNLFVPGVGLVNLPVLAFNPAAQEIKVQLPAAITNAQGTFMLTVQVGTGETKFSTLGLTIGGSGTVVVGPQGPKGDLGDTGPQGPTGLTGPVGPEGLPGNDGLDGAQGPVGPQGPIGLTGPQGLKGDKGDTGLQGPIGLTGAQGVQGPIGLTGPQGLQGEQGPIGLTGATGAQGARGMTFRGAWNLFYVYVPDDAVAYNGSTWLATAANIGSVPVEGAEWTLLAAKGNTGDTGATGAQGLQGPVGLTGAQGVQGLTGLTGATGAQGPMGLTGLQGLQGLIGLTGATGPQGVAGTNGVDGAQGPIGPQGEQGVIGLTGLTGPQGQVGLTGAQGAQGPMGLTGLQGLQGLTGLTGATGPQGVAGTNGVDGAQGPIGPQGEQGVIGLTGLTGPQGPIGLTGLQGLQGLIGLTGATGPQGLKGDTGATGSQGLQGLAGVSPFTLFGTNAAYTDGFVGIGTTNPASALEVLGTVKATAFTGSGASLTSLNASQLTSGTVPAAQIPNFDGSKINAGTITSSQIAAGAVDSSQIAADAVNSPKIKDAAVTTVKIKDGAVTDAKIVSMDASKLIGNGTFVGNGSGLTSLNASQLTSGIVPSARLSGTYSSALTLNNVANSFTGNGSGLTALNADNISTGSLDDALLSTNIPRKNAANIFSAAASLGQTMTVKAGTAQTKGLVVQGFTNQTAKLQDWQDSSGTSLASIKADGEFTAPTITATTGFSGNGSGLTSLNAAQLTTGLIDNARIALTASEIPDLSTAIITTGQFDSARIAAGAVTDAKIASVNASKLTGIIDNDRISLTASEIPDLDATKLTGAIQVDSLGRVGLNMDPNVFQNVTLNVRKVGDSGDPVVVNVELNGGADLFQIQQNGKVWAQDSFITGSDIRLKNSITSLGEVMPRVRQLNPSVYRLNAQGIDAPLHIGFIAQEVQPLFPETVSTNGEYLAVSYGAFGPIAIKAIQEQQAQLVENEARIKSLEERLSRLENLVEQLTK